MKKLLMLLVCLTGFVLANSDMELWAQQTNPTTTYRVPTTGEIVDVIYLPEFDEWWVKCREGRGISVYSYDKRSKKWGHALFIPAKPVKETKKAKTGTMIPENPTKSEESSNSSETEKLQPQKGKEVKGSPDSGTSNTDSGQLPKNGKSVKEKKKWWDPLKLLKRDKKNTAPADRPLP